MQVREEQLLLPLTIVIGALVGLVVVGFIVVTERLGARLYPAEGAAWRRLAIPLAGALGTGFLLARYFPGARGSGIPQTKAALFLQEGYIALRTVLAKLGLCSVTMASGIALGREGPSVQIGAGIASVLGKRLGLSPASIKSLVPVGAAAALAAAFNTPVAAVLFTLEEVMGDLHAPVLGSIVAGSATSWIVLHLVLGDEPLFHVPPYQLVHAGEFVLYAALGLAGGALSAAFVKLLLWQRKHFLTWPRWTLWLQPAVGGLLVGILGWFYPGVLGVGYNFVGQALNGQMAVGVMGLLAVLKVLATSSSYASGNAGGIFGPTLFFGAMMGGAIGGVAHQLLPDYTGSAGAYALVGMGAAFAGTIRVPFTSAIMIFEITRDYSIIVPLMIANLVAYFVSSRLQEEPVYEALQHQDGVHLPTASRAREALMLVGNAYRTETVTLPVTLTVRRAVEIVEWKRGAFPVVDSGGLRGMITADQLRAAMEAKRGDDTLDTLVPEPGPSETLTSDHFPHIHTDHSLETAMQRIAASGLNALPVVSRSDVRALQGTIALEDVVGAYRIGKRQEEDGATLGVAGRPLLVGVLAVLAAVALLTAFLNHFYRAEKAARTERYFLEGQELLSKGYTDQAIGRLREALAASHDLKHRLALGLALEQAGRLGEAAIYFNQVVQSSPEDGPANLGLAREAAARGNVDEATLRYHRAIYGTWSAVPENDAFAGRLELSRLLLKAGRTDQAQAELLGAAAAAPADPEPRKQIAKDFDLLGEAHYKDGDLVSARDAFRAALRMNPDDEQAKQRVEFIEDVQGLDPDRRTLSLAERRRRTRELLEHALDERVRCNPAEDADVKAARAALARRPSRARQAPYEPDLELARRLWSARPAECASIIQNDPAAVILSRTP